MKLKKLSFLKGNQKGQTKRDKRSQIRRFSLIFADFRFSCELQHFGSAEFRRKPQETADFRRKPQKPAETSRNPFVPFSLPLLIPPHFPRSLPKTCFFPLSAFPKVFDLDGCFSSEKSYHFHSVFLLWMEPHNGGLQLGNHLGCNGNIV